MHTQTSGAPLLHMTVVGLITVAATFLLVAAGCTAQKVAPPRAISIAIIGDAGYHYDYLEAKDLEAPPGLAAFQARERAKWIREKRPAAEFEPLPTHRTEPGGAIVTATGIQSVARAVREQCAQPPQCDFGVLLGDNIYPDGATLGKDGHDDADRFRKIFADPYGGVFGGRRDARLYVVLGNHDWRTSRAGAQAQVDYLARTPPFYMNGFFYRVVPPGFEGEVEIFALDTEIILSGLTVREEHIADDGSELPAGVVEPPNPGPVPGNAAERAMAQWLEQSLASSTAKWKIVIGHHPLWSSAGGKFEQARALRQVLLPALCRYADLYLAGHDHTLELHTDDCRESGAGADLGPLPQVVSGAASKQRGINSLFMRQQLLKYPELRTFWARGMTWGFAQLILTGDRAHLRFIAIPDDGSSARETPYEYRFERRTRGRAGERTSPAPAGASPTRLGATPARVNAPP